MIRATNCIGRHSLTELLLFSELLGTDQHRYVIHEQHEYYRFLRIVQKRVRSQPCTGLEQTQHVQILRRLSTQRGKYFNVIFFFFFLPYSEDITAAIYLYQPFLHFSVYNLY